MHEFDSWVIKSKGKAVFRENKGDKVRPDISFRQNLEKTRRREDEKTRRREDEKTRRREDEMGETRFLGKKGKARADIRFR
ncbi:hypothetical protein ACPV34_18180 [Photobacterium damselae]|uniref:hypothetical protein n=1 Tax=Photobacterium damselae TaxID=38293 RepID=UPI004068E9DA